MPRTYTTTTTVYQYDELPTERAKERARDWFREGNASDTFHTDSVVDDFADGLTALGFSISKRHGSRALYWDTNPIGGAFDASWSASRCTADSVETLKAARPNKGANGEPYRGNDIWHNAADKLRALATQYPEAYGSVDADGRGRGVNATSLDTEAEDDGESDEAAAQDFEEVCRDLAHELGRACDREIEYQNSDETVAENIRANEYEFTIDGDRA